MAIPRLSLRRWLLHWLSCPLFLCAPLLLTGCQKDEITTYEAPRSEPLAAAGVRFRQRLIAVAIPQEKQLWVVKLLGPEKQVAAVIDQFDELIKSVELTKEAGKPIAWKLPEGWKQLPGNEIEFRYATFSIAADEALEVSVSRVDNIKAAKLDNINRWRRQIGLGAIQEDQVDQFSKSETIKSGEPAWRVDMTGAMMTPAAKKSSNPISQDRPVKPRKYKIPDGWKEVAPAQFSVANFVIQQGDDRAEVSLSPLSAEGSSLLQNVNRWRKNQLGLPEIDDAQLKKDLKADKVDGVEAQYIKLAGEKKTILGFIVTRGKFTWYLKMIGPKDLVEKQETAFLEFCRSLEF
jgi:hypothetical protein